MYFYNKPQLLDSCFWVLDVGGAPYVQSSVQAEYLREVM